ncbi:MAG: hypothetical protein DI551_12105 [Micavibrio aeruginosavorus]|uniref:Uncharacterized protein n=1 Tax=Micavibrio aeruginosavorus TaxID=349221 RepID=A0A2W5MQ35_9BACT|nr:MAG: hypothetical protein DI551_12105 [Micavibrio aeruginosavorus]
MSTVNKSAYEVDDYAAVKPGKPGTVDTFDPRYGDHVAISLAAGEAFIKANPRMHFIFNVNSAGVLELDGHDQNAEFLLDVMMRTKYGYSVVNTAFAVLQDSAADLYRPVTQRRTGERTYEKEFGASLRY